MKINRYGFEALAPAERIARRADELGWDYHDDPLYYILTPRGLGARTAHGLRGMSHCAVRIMVRKRDGGFYIFTDADQMVYEHFEEHDGDPDGIETCAPIAQYLHYIVAADEDEELDSYELDRRAHDALWAAEGRRVEAAARQGLERTR